MPDTACPRPLPARDGPYQPGITSPAWPSEPPRGVDPNAYGAQYAGQIDRQRHCHIVFADVALSTRAELRGLLEKLTRFARHQMDKKPIQPDRSFDAAVTDRRVSVTIGFGASLFTTPQGDDRFGIAALKPRHLKIIPRVDGDEDFDPSLEVTDLVIIIASDDMYVNEYIFGRLYYGGVHPGIVVRRLERGYSRPDSREPSGFEDGISNPKAGASAESAESFVYVGKQDDEPSWCLDGTYLAYRKIRRRLRSFFKLDDDRRAAVFGIDAATGERLPDAAPHAHAQKINPKRANHRDLFGQVDVERRFIRRPYFFDDGVDGTSDEMRGVHHMSFVRGLIDQYEWPMLMWQTNPDFPTKGAGGDALYASGGASNMTAGYYFMPGAAPAAPYVGSGLLD
ncbi:MAG TPA: Dyp-type peroxidase [Allosphingosinicella sp.]|jgi:deferrochelatase/peroxidase EfeB